MRIGSRGQVDGGSKMHVVGAMDIHNGEWSFIDRMTDGVSELLDYELDFVAGGVDGMAIANGAAILAAGALAIASAPATVSIGLLYGAAVVIGAAGGYMIGSGLVEK